jgi:hypothetical protein
VTSATAWAEYNNLLRELHTARADDADRSETTEETLRARAEQLETLADQIRKQEKRVVRLAQEIRRPVRFVPVSSIDPAKPMPWAEANVDLVESCQATDRALEETEYLGNLPPLMPTWPAWARNAAIYFGFSIPNIFINCVFGQSYVDAAKTEQTTVDSLFTAVAWGCCFWPIAAVVAGIATIRMIGVPRLKPRAKNELSQPKPEAASLHVWLGMAIATGTSGVTIAVIWLFAKFLTG